MNLDDWPAKGVVSVTVRIVTDEYTQTVELDPEFVSWDRTPIWRDRPLTEMFNPPEVTGYVFTITGTEKEHAMDNTPRGNCQNAVTQETP